MSADANYTFNAKKTHTFGFKKNTNGTGYQEAAFLDLSLKVNNYCDNYYGFVVDFDMNFGQDWPINTENMEICFHVNSTDEGGVAVKE